MHSYPLNHRDKFDANVWGIHIEIMDIIVSFDSKIAETKQSEKEDTLQVRHVHAYSRNDYFTDDGRWMGMLLAGTGSVGARDNQHMSISLFCNMAKQNTSWHNNKEYWS